jgi:predicted nucleic acid-binding protein
MGSLRFPFTGRVYVDSVILIYSVERNPIYAGLLRRFWAALAASAVEVVTSQLSILEALVDPLRNGDSVVVAEYESFFELPEIECRPVDLQVLLEAAHLRAEHRGLRTPDSIHVATAQVTKCRSFFTNDKALSRLPGLDFHIAQDLITVDDPGFRKSLISLSISPWRSVRLVSFRSSAR